MVVFDDTGGDVSALSTMNKGSSADRCYTCNSQIFFWEREREACRWRNSLTLENFQRPVKRSIFKTKILKLQRASLLLMSSNEIITAV